MDFSAIDSCAHVLFSNFVNDSNFEFGIISQLTSEGSLSSACDLWVANFSLASHTNWIVLKTEPEVYRKVYVCQLSRYKKISSSVRNRRCGAEVDIRVRPTGVRKAIINVYAYHSHPVNVVQSYRLLRCSLETAETFNRYFEEGLRPSAALARHENTLLAGNESVHRIVANCQLNPTPRQVYHLYEKWRSSRLAGQKQPNVIEQLLARDATFRAQGVKVIIQEEPFIILVLTPIMQRAHALEAAGTVVFVDSSRACTSKDTVLTYLMCATKAGAVPLAVIIHSADGCYTEAFSLLKSALSPVAFGGRGYPNVFITDDGQELRQSLQRVYSQSSLKLCAFHASRAVWKWLRSPDNNILPEHRKYLMSAYKQLRRTGTLCRDRVVCRYPQFELLLAEHEWCLPENSSQTNNYVEATFRILKENVLGRTKASDVVELVDAVTTGMETWCKRKLLEFASMRRTSRSGHSFQSSEYATLANLALGNVPDRFYSPSPSTSWSPNIPVDDDDDCYLKRPHIEVIGPNVPVVTHPIICRTFGRMRLRVQPSSVKRRKCTSACLSCSQHSKKHLKRVSNLTAHLDKRTNWGKYSFMGRGVRDWNNLPREMLDRFPTSLKLFRRRLGKQLIGNLPPGRLP